MRNRNGRPTREIRSHPGEAYFACEHCGDFFHHNGLGMHQFYCQKRDSQQRVEYQARKHTLRLPKTNNTITESVPVQVRFFTDRDKERLHVSLSVADAILLKLGKKAQDLDLIAIPETDEN